MKVGIDMIEIERIEKSISNPSFVKRVYTEGEYRYFSAKKNGAESAAGFFCAKEAFAKALGTGIGAVNFADIEVAHDEKGAPYLILHGEAAHLAEGLTPSLSITHHRTAAAAIVILEDAK